MANEKEEKQFTKFKVIMSSGKTHKVSFAEGHDIEQVRKWLNGIDMETGTKAGELGNFISVGKNKILNTDYIESIELEVDKDAEEEEIHPLASDKFEKKDKK